MSSRAEQITQALVAKLTTPPMASVPSSQIYRDITRAIDRSIETAIAMEEGDEPAPDRGVIGVAYRSLEIRMSAIAKGSNATTLADAPLVEAHNRIMADQSLGGLAITIEEGETTRQREVLEKEVAQITKTYRIQYRTGERSLES